MVFLSLSMKIHRMNKMKQDNLLPYVESGLLIIVGCTTANPYHSINPAIRSRCQIIEVKPLTQRRYYSRFTSRFR